MSMTMEHIATTACPECGCDEVKRFEKSNRGANGQWHERLSLSCGLALHYSPNSERIENEADCQKSPRAVEWKARRAVIIAAMIQAAKDAAGAPGADLDLFAMSLRSDLNLYRDDLERVKS